MKRIIATVLSAIVGLFGYTIVDTAIESRVSTLESRVAYLESVVEEYHNETTEHEVTVRPTESTITTKPLTSEKPYVSDIMQCPKCGMWFLLEWWNPHWEKCGENTCVKCGTDFESEEELSTHIKNCAVDDSEYYSVLSAEELLRLYIGIVKSLTPQWYYIESTVILIEGFIHNPDTDGSDVIAAVEELKTFNVPDAEPVLEALEIKIRDMHSTEVTVTRAKTEVETSA